MDLGIRDRVALVTGGARSLGKADAVALAAEGCQVAIVDLNAEGAEETAREIGSAGGRACGYACDIRDTGQVQEAVARGIIAPNAKLSPLYDRMVKRVAMQREGEPEDVANAVLFLCSERARYITGAVLTVTGGMDLFTF